MTRRAARVDANQPAIVKVFRGAGATVRDVSALGGIGFDLLVMFAGRLVAVEIKDGSKPPSERKLTKSEQRARDEMGRCWALVESEDDALQLLNEMARWK